MNTQSETLLNNMMEVKCPKCSTSFEVEEDLKGAVAECGACSAAFKIPEEGNVGIPFEEVNNIEVICPECKTSHQVPENARGVEAECGVCNTTFTIPEVGIFGSAVSKAPVTPPAQPGRVSGPDQKLEQIQQQKKDTDYSLQNRSNTLRMSRKSIVTNTMMPQMGQGASKGTPKSATPPAARRGTPSGLAKPPSAESAAANTPATPPAAQKKAPPASKRVPPPKPPKKRVAPSSPVAAADPVPAPDDGVADASWPEWTEYVELEDGERILNCTDFDDESSWLAPVVVGFLAVVLIPVSALLAETLGKIVAAGAFGAAGIVAWIILSFMMLSRSGGNKGLVLTNRRAVLITDDGTQSVRATK